MANVSRMRYPELILYLQMLPFDLSYMYDAYGRVYDGENLFKADGHIDVCILRSYLAVNHGPPLTFRETCPISTSHINAKPNNDFYRARLR